MPRRSPPPSAPPIASGSLPPAFPSAHVQINPDGNYNTDPSHGRAKLSKSLSTPGERLPAHGRGLRSRNTVVKRAVSIKDGLSTGAAHYFGIAPAPTTGAQTLPSGSGTIPIEYQVSDSLSGHSQPSSQNQKWEARRRRHCTRRYGGIRETTGSVASGTVPPTPLTATIDVADFPLSDGQLRDPYHVPGRAPSLGQYVHYNVPSLDRGISIESRNSTIGGRSISIEGRNSKYVPLQRRDSVAKMAWDGFSTLLTRGSLKTNQSSVRKRNRLASRSFSPGAMAVDDSVFTTGTSGTDSQLSDASCGNTPGSGLHPESIPMATIHEAAAEDAASRKPSSAMQPYKLSSVEIDIAQKEIDEEAMRLARADTLPIDLVLESLELEEEARRQRESQMIAQLDHDSGDVVDGRIPPKLRREPAVDIETPLSDEVFFDMAPSTSHRFFESHHHPRHHHRHPAPYDPSGKNLIYAGAHKESRKTANLVGTKPSWKTGHQHPERIRGIHGQPDRPPLPSHVTKPGSRRRLREAREKRMQRQDALRSEFGLDVKGKKGTAPEPQAEEEANFWSRIKSVAFRNSNRRRRGVGVVGQFLGISQKKRSEMTKQVRKQLDDFDDHRPYFTYWVTTVQLLVLIVSLCLYGFGPVGFNLAKKSAMVLHSTVTRKQVSYHENANFWLGPRHAALVHLGAKYTPCMRHDKKIYEAVEFNKRNESETSCCIYNDRVGCFQTSYKSCPKVFAETEKWSKKSPGPGGRTSGTVCGQDPRDCNDPKFVEWEDDISKWPICQKPGNNSAYRHMTCEVTGRPCCIGIQGECQITTREYCDFVQGYFHEEATLCSQVSCLGEVCGMIPFFRTDKPDQFYRLFISLFLHAGVIHVILTTLVQFWMMRDLEKLVGCSRIAIIYLCSGIAGNLSSAIFVPYMAEVGPAGSHFGLLAALFVDLFYHWRIVAKPGKALAQLSAVTLFMFLIGLLPWVDNWAHLFGFIFGFLFSLALFPYIQFEANDRKKRLVIVVASLLVAAALFSMLVILFYVSPIWDCEACRLFNCIPFSQDICDNKGLQLHLLPKDG